jgi:hypothetical protein
MSLVDKTRHNSAISHPIELPFRTVFKYIIYGLS